MWSRKLKTDRNREIFRRYSKGDTSYAKLAAEYGVGRNRIRQIVMRIERDGGRVGYAELAADRAWRLAGLASLQELFALDDEQILAIPTVGQKTLDVIRRLQCTHEPER